MKQHITWNQFIELTFEQVSVLQKLINQKYHFIESEERWIEIQNYKYTFPDGEKTNIHTSYTGMLKKCNIGKMIEILSEKYLVGWLLDEYPDVYLRDKNTLELVNVTAEPNELCDALWEAVKETIV